MKKVIDVTLEGKFQFLSLENPTRRHERYESEVYGIDERTGCKNEYSTKMNQSKYAPLPLASVAPPLPNTETSRQPRTIKESKKQERRNERESRE